MSAQIIRPATVQATSSIPSPRIIVVPSSPPETESTRSKSVDTLGLEVTDTFTVTRTPLGETAHYEMTNEQGQVIHDGVGDSLSHALLDIAVETEGKDI